MEKDIIFRGEMMSRLYEGVQKVRLISIQMPRQCLINIK